MDCKILYLPNKAKPFSKHVESSNYNFDFFYKSGLFLRWGKTEDDDPSYSPFGPEILDIEISTICNGINGKPCTHCYKSNTGKGKNMSFDTFKTIFDKMPETLTQVAFGIGDIDANPDMWEMFKYCRSNQNTVVVPNVTINGWNLTDEAADNFSSLCGAVAVSRYQPKDVCYDAVQKLTDKGMTQVNIHMLLSQETLDQCYETVYDMKMDARLRRANAVVFLYLKPKGIRNKFTMLHGASHYEKLISYCFNNKVKFGFDSCSAPTFLRAVEHRSNFSELEMMAESCESSCFSSYINVDGRYFHCSFTEGEQGWKGIDVVNCKDFLKDVWYGDETIRFRDSLITQNHAISNSCRECPIFDLR